MTKNNYQSITLYKDMAPQVLELTESEAGRIYQAIFRYTCYGEDTDFSNEDRFIRSLWETTKLKISAGEAHSKKISETNSSNAKKRWEKEKGNATECDRIQSDATECDRTTITDTVTGTNSSTLTISSTVTNTNTEHADAVFDSGNRPAGAAAAESAAPQAADLFSVKQLLATAKKNKVNLTEEGVHIFHEEMQDSGWILYDEPVEKKYIVRVLREYARKHPEYSLNQNKPDKPNLGLEIIEKTEDYITPQIKEECHSQGIFWVKCIPNYCPRDIFSDEELKFLEKKYQVEWD